MTDSIIQENMQDIYDDFGEAVNMTPKEIERWLKTDESKAVAFDDSKGEPPGQDSAHKVLELKAIKKAQLTDEDYGEMHKVVAFIHRNLRQRPDKTEEELKALPWTHTLRNWGHDPLKKR